MPKSLVSGKKREKDPQGNKKEERGGKKRRKTGYSQKVLHSGGGNWQ